MKNFFKRRKRLVISIIGILFVLLVLWANGRISMTWWRSGTLEDFCEIEKDRVTGASFMSYSDEKHTILLLRDAEEMADVLFSMQIRPKFWQSEIWNSNADIILHDGSDTRLIIHIVNENTIEIDSCVYTVEDNADIDSIRTIFESGEDHSV